MLTPALIRLANKDDLGKIVSIFNEAILAKFATGYTEIMKPNQRTEWFSAHNPDRYPIYVAMQDDDIAGWLSVSPYREGRMIFRFSKEISYYVAAKYFRKGIASQLMQHAIDHAAGLSVKTFLAMVRDVNQPSIGLLEKFNFKKWAMLPDIADMDGIESGLLYYGLRVEISKTG